jgi:hypothetical protein
LDLNVSATLATACSPKNTPRLNIALADLESADENGIICDLQIRGLPQSHPNEEQSIQRE